MPWIGGDPGTNGGVAVIIEPGVCKVHKWPKDEAEQVQLVQRLANSYVPVGAIEEVHSMPGQGVKSMFTFGRAYQAMRTCFFAAKISFEDVKPREWQKACGITPRKKSPETKKFTESQPEFKKRMKAKAKQLYPHAEITDATADAVLIAHYAMLKYGGMTNDDE